MAPITGVHSLVNSKLHTRTQENGTEIEASHTSPNESGKGLKGVRSDKDDAASIGSVSKAVVLVI